MHNLKTITQMLAQTAQQKSATLVGLCVLAAFFMILCLDKSNFKGAQKWILLGFMAFFMVAAILYYFFVMR